MTTTNLNIGINNLSLPNQNSTPTPIPDDSSKISNTSKLYLGPGSPNVPGITNLLFAPLDFVDSVKALFQAGKIHDQVGVFENGLRLASTQLNFISSLAQIIWYIFEGGVYLKILSQTLQNSFAPLAASLPLIGFVICTIEGTLESHGLIRTAQFYSHHYPYEIEALKETFNLTDLTQRQKKFFELLEKFSSEAQLPTEVKNEIETFLRRKDYSNEEFSTLSTNLLDQIEKNIYLTNFQQIQRKYLQISPEKMNEIEKVVQNKLSNLSPTEQQKWKENAIKKELNRKKNDLDRRVHPWLAEEISQNASEIVQNLQSPDPIKNKEAKEKAIEVFKHIKTQTQKKLLIHGTGLAAVLITIAGLILGCVACPFFIPFIFLAIGGILGLIRYCLYFGLMDSKDWEFKPKNCIPAFIKALFKKQEKQAHPPASLTLHFELPRSSSSFQERYPCPNNHLNFTITVPAGIRV